MPDYSKIEQQLPQIESLIGTHSVDAKEIEARFPGASRAIDLVNEFDSSLLVNIAYIYNTHDEAAFGVFNPSLNETINCLRVKKDLESEGFQTNITSHIGPGDKLFAFAPGMPSEEIEQKMRQIFSEKEKTGGLAIGIDSERILAMADNIASKSGLDSSKTSDLKVSELASVIAHEAVHAKGETGEGVPQQVQNMVLNYCIRKLQIPVELSGEMIHAISESWYKKAQLAPFNYKSIELTLRENYLYNRNLFPVNKEKNDSPETLLRKNTNVTESQQKGTEVDLEATRNYAGNKLTEELLENQRVQPLILTIPKLTSSSNNLLKFAGWQSNLGGHHIGGVFGYMNGMDPSWGSPFEADEIKDRPNKDDFLNQYYWDRRYSPLYSSGKISVDRMGHPFFNYDFQIDLSTFEQRNWPSKFNERPTYWPGRPDIATASDKSNALKDEDVNVVIYLIKKIGYLKNLIRSEKRKAARIILNPDYVSCALAASSDFSKVLFFYDNKAILWLIGKCSEEEIRSIEQNIQDQKDSRSVNDFVNLSEFIKGNVNKIFSKCKVLCRLHGINDVYAVGGFVRTLASTKDFSEINDIDFSSSDADDCLKLGGLLASDLGISEIGYYSRTKTMSFEYEGIKMDFRGKFIPYEVRPFLRKNGIKTTTLNFDIYARDFTVNSLIYNFMDNKIYDISGLGLKDLKSRTINTFFNPRKIIPLNPLIITRAILLNLRGFSIPEYLNDCLKELSNCLFNGNLDNNRLAYESEKIMRYGEDGEFMLKEYGLLKLKDILAENKKTGE